MPLIGRFNQPAVVGLFDIARPYPLEHVAEQIELRIGVGAGGGLGHGDQRVRRLGDKQREARPDYGAQ